MSLERELYKEFKAERGWHHIRRTAKTRFLNYVVHPFHLLWREGEPTETHQNKRVRSSSNWQRQGDVHGYPLGGRWDDLFTDYRSVPHSTRKKSVALNENRTDSAPYAPLRIKLDSRRLRPLEESDPDKYGSLINHLVTRAAPKAARFWSAHLSTIPVGGPIVVTPAECFLAFLGEIDPTSHSFDEADLVLYLFLDEGPCLEDDPPIAFSNDCAMDQYDRPIAGWFLICAEHFLSVQDPGETGRSQRKLLDEVLQHEFAHVLGMSGATMPYYRDISNDGAPRTPRPLQETNVLCANGERESIILPADTTVSERRTEKGAKYFEVVTPTVRNVVANHFDCQNATGARLENQEYYNCIGSHWEAQIFGTETMVMRNMPWVQSISAVTLALFEDTGWYKANFSASSGVLNPSGFGYGAGCEFLNSSCIADNDVPAFGKDIYCAETTLESDVKCDANHKMTVRCDLANYTSYEENPVYPYAGSVPAPDTKYQYFSDEGLGAYLRYDADYCPTYSAPSNFLRDNDGIATGPRYTACYDSDTAPNDVYNIESYGNKGSRCFNTVGNISRPLCLNVRCSRKQGELKLIVMLGNGTTVVCEKSGQMIGIPDLDAKMECPRHEIICPGVFCPANCAGRGICRHGRLNGCECFDPSDDSLFCAHSPTRQQFLSSDASTEFSTPSTSTPTGIGLSGPSVNIFPTPIDNITSAPSGALALETTTSPYAGSEAFSFQPEGTASPQSSAPTLFERGEDVSTAQIYCIAMSSAILVCILVWYFA